MFFRLKRFVVFLKIYIYIYIYIYNKPCDDKLNETTKRRHPLGKQHG